MSTTQPDSWTSLGHAPGHAPVAPNSGSEHGGKSSSAAAAGTGGPDAALVQETKTQIRAIVHEIMQLSQSDVEVEPFFDEFLRQVVTALAADGGAVWTCEDDHFELSHQINLVNTELHDELVQQKHQRLLKSVAAGKRATLVPPHSSNSDDEEGNPTNSLLIMGVLQGSHHTTYVIEVFQRGTSGPTSQRGYLRFLTQMCDYANNYLKTRQIRDFVDREELWRQLEQFISHSHRSLDARATTYTIANEACRLLDVDRVAVAWRRGHICRIAAISGVDSFDPRSDEVKQLSELTSRVVAIRRTLWYTGDEDEIPPQIQESLHQYVDYSESKSLGIIPLHREGEDPQETPPFAALIIESLREDDDANLLPRRSRALAPHAAAALANAREHESLFLMPLWKAIGNSTWIARGRQLPKTLVVLALLFAAVASLCFVQADLDVEANGILQPVNRRDVFAKMSGVVEHVAVRNGSSVRQNQILASLASSELTLRIRDIDGQIEKIDEQLFAKENLLLRNFQLDQDAQEKLDGEIRELRAQRVSLNDQLALHLKRSDDLNIVSPIDGEVVSWQVERTLLQRPVNVGEAMMTVVDPHGKWEIELRLPERRLSHLTDAMEAAEDGDPVLVSFVMQSDSQKKYLGTVRELNRLAEQDPQDGTIVRVTVDFDRRQIPNLQYNTTVTAQIHCDREPLGFVLFQDLIETVHARWLLWF